MTPSSNATITGGDGIHAGTEPYPALDGDDVLMPGIKHMKTDVPPGYDVPGML